MSITVSRAVVVAVAAMSFMSSAPAGADVPGSTEPSAPPPAAATRLDGQRAPLTDEALLRAMRDDYVALSGERGRARQALGALNAVRYDRRLADVSGTDEARDRLVAAWYRRYQAVGGPQRVDPRAACRSQERTLREALAGQPGTAAPGRLAMARAEARRCLDRLQGSLALARSTAQELEAVLVEARALLGETSPGALQHPDRETRGDGPDPLDGGSHQAASKSERP
jgi:hypothetical protein